MRSRPAACATIFALQGGVPGNNMPTTADNAQAQAMTDVQQESRQFQSFRHSYAPPVQLTQPAQLTPPAQPYYPQATIQNPPLQALSVEQHIKPGTYNTRTGGKATALTVFTVIVAVLVIVGGASVFALCIMLLPSHRERRVARPMEFPAVI